MTRALPPAQLRSVPLEPVVSRSIPHNDLAVTGRLSEPEREDAVQQWVDRLAVALDRDDATGAHAAREAIVLLTMPVAARIALRYRNRGEPLADVTQVALLNLTKAVETFDPSRGHDLMSFLVPSIRGGIKRHFRDAGWAVRPPRRVQEQRAEVDSAAEILAQRLGRSPTVSELAVELSMSPGDIEECLASAAYYTLHSLDVPARDGDTTPDVAAAELGYDAVEARTVVAPLLQHLAPRERRIIGMRFFENRTQSEIAAEIGVSQMQVSRLISASLARMRELAGGPSLM